ncbi:MAG: hypothetical protein HY331_00335 [Chloroflexi bacterium]|nr:hypothetical protein [Chloroflexota bacterium]
MATEICGSGPARVPHVVGIGHVAYDWIFLVEQLPEPDSKTTAAAEHVQLGGPVPVALAAAVRQGLRAGWVGALGADAAGRALMAGFATAGVDVTHVRISRCAVTGLSQIWGELQHGRRTIVHRPTTAPPVEPDEAIRALASLPRADWLHLDAWSFQRPAQLAAARFVRERGGRVSIDLGEPKGAVDELLALADVVVAPARTAKALTGEPPLRAARRLLGLGPRLAVVTMGPRGAIGATPSRRSIRVPAPWVHVVDTTGAGDVFCGTLVARLALGDDDETALTTAVETAAAKCAQIGNGTRVPALGEV